jgi:TPR repeat protein
MKINSTTNKNKQVAQLRAQAVNGDAASFEQLKSEAQRNDLAAQVALGEIYRDGQGIPQDLSAALHWFNKAAARSEPQSQFNIGMLYHEGKGVEHDATKAVQWWRKAAKQEHAEAQYMLGCAHHEGEGIPATPDQAAQWFRKAAKQGHADAQNMLGVLYTAGTGVHSNLVLAQQWFTKASDQGNACAKLNLATMYLKDMLSVEENDRAAQELERTDHTAKGLQLLQESAQLGDEDAQNLLGEFYQKGNLVPQDHEQAVLWFTKAAEQGDASAQNNLANHYAAGRGVAQNSDLARELYEKAAAQGHKQARSSLKMLEWRERVRNDLDASENTHIVELTDIEEQHLFKDLSGGLEDAIVILEESDSDDQDEILIIDLREKDSTIESNPKVYVQTSPSGRNASRFSRLMKAHSGFQSNAIIDDVTEILKSGE